MGVYKEISKADGSGSTQFFRISSELKTAETVESGSFYIFKDSVNSRADLPQTDLELGYTYYIKDEEVTVYWNGVEWVKINATMLSVNYNEATNKPFINDVPLIGNKSLEELGIQPAGDYIEVIPEEYVTEEELESKDYATKTYVATQIAEIEHFHKEIIESFPLIGKENVIYLKRKSSSQGDSYDEYIWTGNSYELIGSTATDLSDYYKKNETDSLLLNKVDKMYGKGLSTNDFTNEEKIKLSSLENYDDTELRTAVSNLHNYDDTEVKEDISELISSVNALESEMDIVEETIIDDINGLRLIKMGEHYEWNNIIGDNLTFDEAVERLSTHDTILWLEDLESDSKSLPCSYSCNEDEEGKYIQILYIDREERVKSLIIKDSIAEEKDYGFSAYIDTEVSNVADLPNDAKFGQIRKVKSRKAYYVYNGIKWEVIGSSGGGASVVDEYTESDTEAYSCDYINEQITGFRNDIGILNDRLENRLDNVNL